LLGLLAPIRLLGGGSVARVSIQHLSRVVKFFDNILGNGLIRTLTPLLEKARADGKLKSKSRDLEGSARSVVKQLLKREWLSGRGPLRDREYKPSPKFYAESMPGAQPAE
jgi:hypothetical protein